MDKALAPDQFYTKPEVATWLMDWLAHQILPRVDRYLEPAAGSGAFSSLLPHDKREAIDLLPLAEHISKGDFFAYLPTPGLRYMVLGNPPFGKNSSLVVRFFNRAAIFAEVIAFIVPRTFKKHSVVDRLNPYFHLLAQTPVPDNAFVENGEEKDVPTIFQVWVRQKTPRVESHTFPQESDFSFVSKEASPDLSVQRVGANAGRVRVSFADRAKTSHYFLKVKEGMSSKEVFDILESIDWSEIKNNTAGNPSISKRELLEAYASAKIMGLMKRSIKQASVSSAG